MLRFQLSDVSAMVQAIFLPVWSSYTTEVSRGNDFKIHSELMKCTVIVMHGWLVELVQNQWWQKRMRHY